MAIEVGTRLGHYEVVSSLGAGGMGEVYRAKDTKLGREVAIKLLLKEVSSDPERLARFEREARVLASLNHDNIASLYAFEQEGGTTFLVMELVEGETLAERIKRGAIPVDEALPLFLQIAEGLEAAHEKGVIHRDLKPANVMVDSAGKVKLLDFGLAKALEPAAQAPLNEGTHSPTLSQPATGVGVLLGTAAYMSPEQARGLAADKRSDLWAFGVVLWELLTGRHLFRGETVSDTLAAVLRADPEWDRLPASTPRSIRRLLRRCLARDPRDRIHAAADARLEIQDALSTGVEEQAVEGSPRPVLPWALGASLLAIALVLAGVLVLREPSRPVHVALSLAPPEGSTFDTADGPVTLSPDGTQIATVVLGGTEQLAVRRLDSLRYRLLPNNGNSLFDPFWSPDGRFLAYFNWDGKLKKIDVGGGPPLTLTEARDPRGGTWNEDDVIVFSPRANGPLYRVSASGGDPKQATALDPERGETGHWRPRFLPDGRRFLYLALTTRVADVQTPRIVAPWGPETVSLWVGSLDGDTPRQISGSFESAVSYAAPGYLLFLREGTLFARPFDVGSLDWSGEPVVLAQDVEFSSEYATPAFSVSRNGVLAYHSQSPPPDRKLVWRDRKGASLSELVVSGAPHSLDLVPGGRRAAVVRKTLRQEDVWIVDLDRGTHVRLTFDAASESGPTWSPDGERVAYIRRGPGTYRVLAKEATGVGSEVVVFESEGGMEPVDWSPDGRFLLIEGIGLFGDLWVVSVEGEEEPVHFASTPFAEHSGRFSPDGRWIAYVSNESGRPEIYIRPWPLSGGKWQVSTAGGDGPRWRGDGAELFYLDPARHLMAVSIEAAEDGALNLGVSERLFEAPNDDAFDPSPDGQRFLFIESLEETETPLATVVLEWQALME